MIVFTNEVNESCYEAIPEITPGYLFGDWRSSAIK
jgi:hypothetical protein